MNAISVGEKVQTAVTNTDGTVVNVDGTVVNFQRNWRDGDMFAVQLDEASYANVDHYISERTVWCKPLDMASVA